MSKPVANAKVSLKTDDSRLVPIPRPTASEIDAARERVSLAQVNTGMEVYQKFDVSSELADVLYEVYAAMRAQEIIEDRISAPVVS